MLRWMLLHMMHNNGVPCQRYRSIYLNSKHMYIGSETDTTSAWLSVCDQEISKYTQMQLATPWICATQSQIKMQEEVSKRKKDNRVINI